MNTADEIRPAGYGRRVLRSVLARLPRGRVRAARVLGHILRRPFIDHVPPYELGVRLAIDPSDPFQLEIWLGAYQPHVVSFLRRAVRPGDRVLCAGLHIGYVAAIARRLAGPRGMVVSAEPDSAARQRAALNLQLSDNRLCAPMHVLDAGLSDRDETLVLHKSWVLGHSSFGTAHQEEEQVSVPVRRGDRWLAELGVEAIDVMVLDVEGWELSALRGLGGVLANSRGLRAMIEVSDWALRDAGTSAADLLAFCWQAGLVVQWAEESDDTAPYGVVGAVARPNQTIRANDVLCVASATASTAVAVQHS